MSTNVLTAELASKFAQLALAHVEREYPNKLEHVLTSAGDVKSPSELHPVFFGSFDWHSCVHGYWLLATILRRCPDVAERADIESLFARRLTAPGIAAEVAYLARPDSQGFERPYGWAWVLMLAAELMRHDSRAAKEWQQSLRPLADAFVERFTTFLPKSVYPIRTGTHFNSAFAISMALEYARATDNKRFRRLLDGRATSWFSKDENAQAWEPGGDDFLSPVLMEAECMRRSMDAEPFNRWFSGFLPHLADRQPETLFSPASVSDRSDGKIAHLDGLNLSRAWCYRAIARSLADSDARKLIMLDAADRHIDASLPHIAGDYAGEHWLATFAMLALTA